MISIYQIHLSFTDFWPSFNPTNNFLLDLFKKIYSGVSTRTTVQNADVLIYSCFGNNHQHITNSNILKIFYTGENLRPNFNACNYSLSFDFDDYNGYNVRLPLWLFYIDWFNKGKEYGNPMPVLSPDKLENNEYFNRPKTKFCCLVNRHLANDRNTIIQHLSNYKQLGLYGAPFGNTIVTGEDSKYKTIADYKFNICFENANYPGYHTEKLLHAKSAGCIPIYNGAKTVEQDFNKECFINYQDFNNMDDFCQYIKEIDNNDDLYNKIKNQPLFTSPISLDKTMESISKLLSI